MYMQTNDGPSDEPCGTTISKQVVADWPEPYLTNDGRLSMYDMYDDTMVHVRFTTAGVDVRRQPLQTNPVNGQ